MEGPEPAQENNSAFAFLMDRDRRAEVDATAAKYADTKRRRVAARRSPDPKSLVARAAALVPGAHSETGGGVSVSDGLFKVRRRARLLQHAGGLSGEGSDSEDCSDRIMWGGGPGAGKGARDTEETVRAVVCTGV